MSPELNGNTFETNRCLFGQIYEEVVALEVIVNYRLAYVRKKLFYNRKQFFTVFSQ